MEIRIKSIATDRAQMNKNKLSVFICAPSVASSKWIGTWTHGDFSIDQFQAHAGRVLPELEVLMNGYSGGADGGHNGIISSADRRRQRFFN
jgi:hypothetical protein